MYTHTHLSVCVHMFTFTLFSNHKYILCIWKVEASCLKGNVPGQTVWSSRKSTGRVGPGSHPSSTASFLNCVTQGR